MWLNTYRDFCGLYEDFGGVVSGDPPVDIHGDPVPYIIRPNGVGSPPPVVPEPLTMASAFFAIAGLGGYIRRRRKSSAQA